MIDTSAVTQADIDGAKALHKQLRELLEGKPNNQIATALHLIIKSNLEVQKMMFNISMSHVVEAVRAQARVCQCEHCRSTRGSA